MTSKLPIHKYFFDPSFSFRNPEEYFENIKDLLKEAYSIVYKSKKSDSDEKLVLVLSSFISDEEIRATLKYAEENKNNVELIDQILDKARPQKKDNGTFCQGLNHREASVLLACEIPEKVQEMYKLAEEIKQAFYGNRIVMFAPLYL